MLRLRTLLLLLLCALALSAPASASHRREEPSQPAQAKPGEKVARFAKTFIGIRYVYGGSSPRTGFDCSGLVAYVYDHFGVSLPHYTVAQYSMGSPVSRSQLEAGDLVFFDGLGHVGIYIGGGQFIHSPHTGDVVKISGISGWYAATYVGARRL
jgi:peptidoglycan DL-endopeptidase CwlO